MLLLLLYILHNTTKVYIDVGNRIFENLAYLNETFMQPMSAEVMSGVPSILNKRPLGIVGFLTMFISRHKSCVACNSKIT